MGGFLFLAAVCDAVTGKIPNALILAGLLMGLYVCLMAEGIGGLLTFVWKALWPVLVLFLLFLLRALGAGDIKLFSVISVFLSAGETVEVICVSFLLGAVVSLLRMLFMRQTLYRMGLLMAHVKSCVAEKQLRSYQTPETPESYLHFAVCIFAAYLVVFIPFFRELL